MIVATIDIDFQWGVGRYYELVDGDTVIRQTSRHRDFKRPLQIARLYLKFAELDASPTACLDFARSWGLLRQPAKPDASERVSDWKGAITRMREFLNIPGYVKMGGILAKMAKVDVELVSGDQVGDVFLRFQPPNLFEAMMVQLAQSQSNGASLHTCNQCGRWFEVGRSGKRTLAKFCSVSCRNRFHYEQRANPRTDAADQA
jgi:hypothetical protein